MKHDGKIEIEEIINGVICPKDNKCCKSKFDGLCKAEDIGLESFTMCLLKNPQECVCSLSFGDTYFCKCPLRVYIFKEFQR